MVAPVGTGAVMLVLLQFDARVWTPLNVTKLCIVPTVGPKFVPVMMTLVPMGPEEGEIVVMAGGGVTVKSMALLGTLFTVTTTLPVVAPVGTVTLIIRSDQLVTVKGDPFKVAVLTP